MDMETLINKSSPPNINTGVQTPRPPSEPVGRFLSFDGSFLGTYKFYEVISWIQPVTKISSGKKTAPVYVILTLPDVAHSYPVILKRNRAGKTDQAVADELKPLFGLQKMGTHRIRLNGLPRKVYSDQPWLIELGSKTVMNMVIASEWSEYYVFRATTHRDEAKDETIFVPFANLEDTYWLPTVGASIKPGHREFFFEVQKILVYRELLRISDTNLSNILVKQNPHKTTEKILPLSIDEMKIKDPLETYRRVAAKLDGFFFPKTTSRTEVLIKMLGLTNDNYTDQLELFRNSISRVINRVDPDKIWLVDSILNQLVDRVSLYYKIKTSAENSIVFEEE